MVTKLYELLYIVDSTLDEPTQQRIINDIHNTIVKAGGDIKKESNWGSRRLSYEIKKKVDGIYINIEFHGSTEIPDLIHQYVTTHQGILRHLVISVPKAKLVQEKMDADRLQKQLDAAERERQAALTPEATVPAESDDVDEDVDDVMEEEEETV